MKRIGVVWICFMLIFNYAFVLIDVSAEPGRNNLSGGGSDLVISTPYTVSGLETWSNVTVTGSGKLIVPVGTTFNVTNIYLQSGSIVEVNGGTISLASTYYSADVSILGTCFHFNTTNNGQIQLTGSDGYADISGNGPYDAFIPTSMGGDSEINITVTGGLFIDNSTLASNGGDGFDLPASTFSRYSGWTNGIDIGGYIAAGGNSTICFNLTNNANTLIIDNSTIITASGNGGKAADGGNAQTSGANGRGGGYSGNLGGNVSEYVGKGGNASVIILSNDNISIRSSGINAIGGNGGDAGNGGNAAGFGSFSRGGGGGGYSGGSGGGGGDGGYVRDYVGSGGSAKVILKSTDSINIIDSSVAATGGRGGDAGDGGNGSSYSGGGGGGFGGGGGAGYMNAGGDAFVSGNTGGGGLGYIFLIATNDIIVDNSLMLIIGGDGGNAGNGGGYIYGGGGGGFTGGGGGQWGVGNVNGYINGSVGKGGNTSLTLQSSSLSIIDSKIQSRAGDGGWAGDGGSGGGGYGGGGAGIFNTGYGGGSIVAGLIGTGGSSQMQVNGNRLIIISSEFLSSGGNGGNGGMGNSNGGGGGYGGCGGGTSGVYVGGSSTLSGPIGDGGPSNITIISSVPTITRNSVINSSEGHGGWAPTSPGGGSNGGEGEGRLTSDGLLYIQIPASKPILISPENNTNVCQRPLFNWYALHDSTTNSNLKDYILQVDDDSDFSSPIIDQVVTDSEHRPSIQLPFGSYYWWVKARYSSPVDVSIGWSDVWSANIISGSDLTLHQLNISISPSSPIFVGTLVYLNSTIWNYGDVATNGVDIYYYDGNPDINGDLIPDIGATVINNTITNVNPNSGIDVSVTWTPLMGDIYEIYVWIDPYNLIAEICDSNNIESANVRIIMPDLTTSSIDITFSPISPAKFGLNIFVNATINNIGNGNATGLLVTFYDGDPDTDNDLLLDITANEIGSTTIDVASSSLNITSIIWNPVSVGWYDIYVWADPNNNSLEYNYHNNIDYSSIYVDGTLPLINSLNQIPTTNAYNSTTIYTNVSDDFELSDIYLWYSYDGIIWDSLLMDFQSGTPTDAFYKATIPAPNYETLVQYYVNSNDLAGNDNNSVTLNYISNFIPEITGVSKPHVIFNTTTSVNITANITDTDGLNVTKVFYSNDGGSSWSNTSMTFGSGDEYYGIIPSQILTTEMLFFVYCTDNIGMVNFSHIYSYIVDGIPPDFRTTLANSSGFNSSTSVIISSEISDNIGVANATLWYSLDDNSSWNSIEMNGLVGSSYSIFKDDMEYGSAGGGTNPLNGWTHSGSADEWEHGFPSYGPGSAYSGSYCWGTDLDNTYNFGSNYWLKSPKFNLQNTTTAYLSYWNWVSVSGLFNVYAEVEISVDGNSWTQLMKTPPAPPFQWGITGWNYWHQNYINISAYSGNPNVWVRFRLNCWNPSTETLVYAGWYIDDVKIITNMTWDAIIPPFVTDETVIPYYIYSMDLVGNSNISDILYFSGDFDPPHFVNITNISSPYSANDEFAVFTNISDNVNINQVTMYYSYNGTNWTTASMNFVSGSSTNAMYNGTIPPPLVDTIIYYYIVTNDTSGNLNVSSTFTYTTEPPIANACENVTVPQGTTVIFNGSNSSDDCGIVNYTWTIVDGSLIILYGLNVSHEFNTIGNYTVTLNVTDMVGNWDTDTCWVNVTDGYAPTSNAGSGWLGWFTATPIAVPYFAMDNYELKNITLYYRHGTVNSTWNTWTYFQTLDISGMSATGNFSFTCPKGEGYYQFRSIAYDEIGNEENPPIDNDSSIGYDCTNPVASVGTDRQIIQNTNVLFDGSASFDNLEIVNFTWSFIEESNPTYLYDAINNYIFRYIGNYLVTLNVSDATGNWDEDTLWVNVTDGIPPSSNAGSGLLGRYSVPIIDIPYSANDNVQLKNITLYYRFSPDGVNWSAWALFQILTINGKTFTGNFSFTCALGEGNYEFYTITCDVAGFEEAVSGVRDSYIIYDRTAPSIISINTDRISPLNADLVELTLIFNDIMNQSVQPTVTFSQNSPYNTHIVAGDWTSSTVWVGTFDITASTGDGTHTLNVSGAKDLAGNVMDFNATYTFVIDTTPPSSQTSALPTYATSLTFTIVFTTNDEMGSGVKNVTLYYRRDGSSWIMYDVDEPANGTISFIAPSDGFYEFYTLATDNAGNVEEPTWDFDACTTVDTTSPILISYSPIGTNVSILSNITITFSEDMNRTAVENALVLTDGVMIWTVTNGTVIWSVDSRTMHFMLNPELAYNAIYDVFIHTLAKDLAGNPTALEYSWSFTTLIDTDGDEIPDSEDTDDDNDGYLDNWEEFLGTDPLDSSDTPQDTDIDDIPDGDTNNTQSWMDTDDDNDGVLDSDDPAPLDPTITTIDDSGIEGYWWVLLLLVILIAALLFFMRKKPEVMSELESVLETEICPKCGFDIEKGSNCPFCAEEIIEKKVEQPKPKPIEKPRPQKATMSNDEILARIEKAYKEGKMSEEQYLKNLAKFKK